MLSANVGFLAIPGVILSNLNSNLTSTSQVVIFTSYSQIASSLSMEASIGSIIIALLLVRLNRAKHNEGPTGAVSGPLQLMYIAEVTLGWAVGISHPGFSWNIWS
jgi:hypothetical protein